MFNESGFFGILVINMTNHLTGNVYLTLLTLVFIIFLFFLAMRIPIELTAILVVPLLIVFMSQNGGDWKTITAVIMLYLAIMFGRFFIK